MDSSKKNLLILCDYYLPTTKGRGPAKSIASVAALLKSEFNIYLLTRDRDYGSATAYSDIEPGIWNSIDGIYVRYLQKCELKKFQISTVIATIEFDVIYLNSFFSLAFTVKTLILRRIGWRKLHRIPILLAPRGELSDDAIGIKPLRKYLYLALAKFTHLYANISFHAESQREASEIARNQALFSAPAHVPKIIFAPCPLPQVDTQTIYCLDKQPGQLRICFVARISRIKNLDFAIDLLCNIKGVHIQFDIFGPAATPEDELFLAECQRLARRLPTNIQVQFLGSATPDTVIDIIARYHLFFLPTRSENFGHAIFEALSAGRPVLISNQTPWRNLAADNIGWDLDLDAPSTFIDVINMLAAMDSANYIEKVHSITAFIHRKNHDGEAGRLIKRLFLFPTQSTNTSTTTTPNNPEQCP